MITDDTFRITWKHNARRNLEDEDVKIFKVAYSVTVALATFHFCIDSVCILVLLNMSAQLKKKHYALHQTLALWKIKY